MDEVVNNMVFISNVLYSILPLTSEIGRALKTNCDAISSSSSIVRSSCNGIDSELKVLLKGIGPTPPNEMVHDVITPSKTPCEMPS